ncbi:choice-of-anchor Q domain-containing protein, partial [candidate division CSSED10-310 bacterium]
EVYVRTATELADAVSNANAGGPGTIVLYDGTYTLSDMLWVQAEGVTVRSESGDREAVIIQGKGMNGEVTHIFNVAGSRFTVRDVTLQQVSQHAIQLQIDIDSVLIRNVHILDTGEQMVKVAYDQNDARSSDNGIMESCLLEYSAGIGPQYYIGGIDAHFAKNWIVRANIFKAIRSPSDDTAEHAIHFWSDSENTLVERNLIINCDRGIGFGLGDRGHKGGIIRNNMIYHNTTEGFADVGIAVESASSVQVYNNTVFLEHSYPNAIEYRFSETNNAYIANNLTNKVIAQRDGGSATLEQNVTNAASSWFINVSVGDLHLSSALSSVVDQGVAISGLTDDFDGDSRPQGAGIDIGADEYQ